MFLDKHGTVISYIVGAAASIGCVVLGYVYHIQSLVSQAELARLWLNVCYPGFILISLVVPLLVHVSPWLWSTVLVLSTFISIAVAFGTQVPTLEGLLMLALAFPYVAASYFGGFIRSKWMV